MSDITADCLAAIPLFRGLSAEALAPLCETMRRFNLRRGEMLFQKGEPGNSMILIEEGKLKVYTLGEGERQVVLDILGPNDVLGEMALLDGKPRSAYAQAEEDCVLLALDREPFLAHLQTHPETAIHLLSYLSERMRQMVLQAESLPVNDSSARLAHVLLFLAERDGEVERGLITSTLRKKDLAAAIGTSEEWVTHKLNEWSHDGIIGMPSSRRLLLHDVETLRRLSRGED